MGILKSAADTVYTFRFLNLLVTPFEKTKAYEYGIIDETGKKNKNYQMNTVDSRDKYREAYTPFHRLVFNIKRLMAKVPGGGSRLASYAAALYLIKDSYNVSDKKLEKALREAGVDPLDLIMENTEWFVLEDKRLSPGVYKLKNEKVLNQNFEDVVSARDYIRVEESCLPVGDIFGLDIYEVTHVNTNKKVFVAAKELD